MFPSGASSPARNLATLFFGRIAALTCRRGFHRNLDGAVRAHDRQHVGRRVSSRERGSQPLRRRMGVNSPVSTSRRS